MAALDPAYVVIELNRCGVRIGFPTGARADNKAAGHGETALMWSISAINQLGSQIAGVDIVVGKAMNADPVHARAELIHERRTKQISIAEGPRLICVIQAALRAGQNVVRS